MRHVSEDWHTNKEKQDAILKRFIAGELTHAVMCASFYALGLRGDYLNSEINIAVHLRNTQLIWEKCRAPKKPPEILVMEYGRNSQRFRFINWDAADNAIKLLRKQPNVALACRFE